MGKKQRLDTEIPTLNIFKDFDNLICDIQIFDQEDMTLLFESKNKPAKKTLEKAMKDIRNKRG